MRLPLRYCALLRLYSAGWTLALPFLRRNARLKDGFAQRLAPHDWAPPCDIWIQAASGGEAWLAAELLPHLAKGSSSGAPLRLLLSSFTRQGIDVLEQAAQNCPPELSCTVRFMPFDRPPAMRRALAQTRPKAVVLLETELWPGLMLAANEAGIPLMVLNARMSEKSVAGYRRLPGLWPRMAPRLVAAISPEDAARFASLFALGENSVTVVPNIKFDRALSAAKPAPLAPEAAALLSGPRTRVLLASTREEEENALLSLIASLRAKAPEISLILAPRHMHRVPAWREMLDKAGIPFALRSAATAPGNGVLIWDAFGEMMHLYATSHVVFVGGSLAPLGGQNYLEALGTGLSPFVGPHLDNFAWIGPELARTGLVRIVPDAKALEQGLLEDINSRNANPDLFDACREDIRARFKAWAAERTGGAARCAQLALTVAFSGKAKAGARD